MSNPQHLEGLAADAGRAKKRARAAAEVAVGYEAAGTPHLGEGWRILERMHLETAQVLEERAKERG